MIGDVGIIISTMRGADFALPADFVVVVLPLPVSSFLDRNESERESCRHELH